MFDLVINDHTYNNVKYVKFNTPNGIAYYYPHKGGIDISLSSSASGNAKFDIRSIAETALSLSGFIAPTIKTSSVGVSWHDISASVNTSFNADDLTPPTITVSVTAYIEE